MLLAVAFWASNILVIKILGSSERSKAQLFYVMLFSSIFSLPMALYDWKPMEAWQINYILALALCYFIHTITFFKALKYADISTVMPYDYTRLIFTGILGYFFLGESPDYLSLIGFGLIIFGGIFAVTHEAARKKSKLSEAKKMELEAECDKV
jgi:S-adenosylmethionine uptake transporter